MKNNIRFLTLFVFISTQIMFSQSNQFYSVATPTPGERQFNISLPGNGGAVFLDFKDGHFSTQASTSLIYQYSVSQNNIEPELNMVERYRNGIIHAYDSAGPFNTNPPASATPPSVNMTGNIEISSTWNNSPGDENFYIITIKNNYNNSSIPDEGIVTISLPPNVSIINGYNYAPNDTFDPSNVVWRYSDLAFGEERNFFLRVLVNPIQLTSQNLFATVSATLDSDFISDVYSTSAQIPHSTRPYDPNLMVVSTDCVEDLIDESQKLVYLVHFQNTGKGPAQDVTVNAFLPDPSLVDYNSIKELDSSHPCTWTIGNGSVLQIEYTGVNLPGLQQPSAGTIFPANQTKGYFMYSICTNTNLQAGNLESYAEIIFDEEQAITTNHVNSDITECHGSIEFCDPGSGDGGGNDPIPGGGDDNNMSIDVGQVIHSGFDVYPNPVYSKLNIISYDLESDTEVEIRITDTSGRVWIDKSYRSEPHLQLDLQNLPNGLYFYTINTPGTNHFGRVVKR